MDLLQIDGSAGEGGGQVLRTALALSLVTGRPFRIDGIRQRRKNPGLQRQHLACVLSARDIGGGSAEGAALGSASVTFRPGPTRPGNYRFSVGTAGSTTLVLQTVLPALLLAAQPSELSISGGTHNPMAPPTDFVSRAFAPLLLAMGARCDVHVQRHGFAPAGGGSISVRIQPTERLQPLELLTRTPQGLWRARALLCNLPDEIGARELDALVERFTTTRLHPEQSCIERVHADGAGNVLVLELPLQSHTEVLTAFGERGVPAERVADVLATEALAFWSADVPVGAHLADQLLLPLALAGRGAFATVEPTLHCTTNARLIERFLPVRFSLRQDVRAGRWIVECGPL